MITYAKLKHYANFRTGLRVEPIEQARRYRVKIRGRWYLKTSLVFLDYELGAFLPWGKMHKENN